MRTFQSLELMICVKTLGLSWEWNFVSLNKPLESIQFRMADKLNLIRMMEFKLERLQKVWVCDIGE